MDAACLPALARIGMLALDDVLRGQVERLPELPDDEAAVIIAKVERLAGMMVRL